jgi:hypothetical protein
MEFLPFSDVLTQCRESELMIHLTFTVYADVTASGVTGGIIVPEPSSFSLIAAGVAVAWFQRRRLAQKSFV